MDVRNTIVSLLIPATTLLYAPIVQATVTLPWNAPTSVPDDSAISVVVFMEDTRSAQVHAAASRPDLTRASRIHHVSSLLRAQQVPGESDVARFLNSHAVRTPTRYWIAPAFAATIPAASLSQLLLMPGVRKVVPDAKMELVTPVDSSPAPSLVAGVSDALQVLGVPTLWQQGLTGRGRLVASFDTGVRYDHPALLPKWRGQHAALSTAWFSTLTPDSPPADKTGHGTHTMGIMVGSAGADTVGVAPDAEWITAGVIDQGRDLSGTISDILAAFQWSLNPDGDPITTDDVPDVILNSWGIPAGLFGDCDDTFWQVIDNVEAAGIVTIFAAGNEGPDPKSVRSPANRPTSPLNTFAVGAVANDGTIANFSSRGPSLCDTTVMKPEVVAPGINIRSSTKDGAYGFMSGTSMSAPFIAGLVALLRQYNPDLTVSQIKNAFVQSAIDLGSPGEDNAYGYGLVDASQLLDHVPPPGRPNYTINQVSIDGNGLLMPGETSNVTLLVSNLAVNTEAADGRLEVVGVSNAVVTSAQSFFYFGPGGGTAAGSQPFTVAVPSDVPHGDSAAFRLILTTTDGLYTDTVNFTLVIGYPPAGTLATAATAALTLSVSDFGQFGFAPGSIYNLNGAGLRYAGSPNLLYEGGIFIARNDTQLSSALRGSDGGVRRSDFVPQEDLVSQFDFQTGGNGLFSRFTDAASAVAIPITVNQRITTFDDPEDDKLLIFRYWLVNTALSRVTDLSFGFLADLDFSGPEPVTYEPAENMIYQSSGGVYIGLVGLAHLDRFVALDNGAEKTGYTEQQLLSMLNTGTALGDTTGATDDRMMLVGTSPFTLEPLDSTEIAFALVAGSTLEELHIAAEQARQRYHIATDVNADNSLLPSAFTLRQNYPNPFNPTTTIGFSLTAGAKVTLEIYNSLGQLVKTALDAYLPAGDHTVVWDATDNGGNGVASGIYFYRLRAAGETSSRKMVLLR